MSETIRRDANALTLDLFQVFIQPLEAELGAKSSHAAGRSHGIANSHEYFARMEAINFTQAHDDGATTRDLDKAQVILVGVSRCGKTPTSLYLALQFGVRAANFPLTPDDFTDRRLPASVLPFRDKLFGLTIQPERLREIREERRPRQQVRGARQLPLRSARSRGDDGPREHPDARHDDQVDRGDRDDDPAPREAANGTSTDGEKVERSVRDDGDGAVRRVSESITRFAHAHRVFALTSSRLPHCGAHITTRSAPSPSATQPLRDHLVAHRAVGRVAVIGVRRGC